MQNILRNFLTTAVLALSAATAAHAQMVIDSLPYTITAGGTYVLNNNLASTQTSGNLITINASNVTIDFQQHYITGPSASLASTSLVGISANERSNLTIRNGTIAYCKYGIDIEGNGESTTNNVDQQVTGMRVTYCNDIGINIVSAPSSVISGCQISQIGTINSDSASGINIDGAGVVVQGCTISNIVASGTSTRGVYSDPGSFTRQCQISNAYIGVQLGIYQDNLASAVSTGFSSGTDAGGNTADSIGYTPGAAMQPNSMSSKPRIH